MMRTLFVSNVVPWPLVAGDRIRGYHLLRALAGISDVTLVCLAYTEEERRHLEALQSLAHERHMLLRDSCRYRRDANRPRVWRVAKALIDYCEPRVPVTVKLWESPDLARLLDGLRNDSFDLVWAQWLGAIPFLTSFIGTRRIVNLNDVESRRLAYRLRHAPLYRLMPLDLFEYPKLRRYERRLSRLSLEFVVCSDIDKQAIGNGSNIWVVPNGIELNSQSATCPSADGHSLLFVGEMSYAPNVDAVRFFVRRVLPTIRQRVPAARLVIVGRHPDPSVRALHDGTTVVVTGSVPAVAPYLQKATALVVPIRFGGGTRIKILEAMAHRTPVVSTNVGAEGIRAVADRHLLLADAPDAFAAACIRVLIDEPLRRQLAASAYELVTANYQWTDIERTVKELVRESVSRRPAATQAKETSPMQRSILHVEWARIYGGSARNLEGFLATRSDNRYRHLVCLYNELPDIRPLTKLSDGLHVLSLPARRRFAMASQMATLIRHLRTARAIYRLVRRENVRLIRFNNGPSVHVGGLLAARLARVPCVVRLRSFPEPLDRWWRWLAPKRTWFVANSEAVRSAYGALGIPTERLTTIYNGTMVKPLRQTRAGPHESSFSVGMLGRLVTWKGAMHLVRAAALVLREAPDARFYVAGDADPSEPGFADELRAEISQLGLGDRVSLMGFCTDTSSFLQSLGCLVNPSYPAEPFGMSIVEAMALGCPVIATAGGGALELLEHERSGLLVPPHDVAALAAAILRLRNDASLRESIGLASRTRVTEHFDVRRQTAKEEALLHAIMAEGRGLNAS